MALKSYEELVKVDVRQYCEERDGFTYLNWAKCIELLRQNGATEVYWEPIPDPQTGSSLRKTDSLLKKGDKFIDELEAALDDDEKMEIWEVNLAEPQASSSNKFKAKYFQGYLTEIDKTSNAEDNVELSLTFGLEGKGVDGYATVTAEQQEVAAYVFADTQKTGA